MNRRDALKSLAYFALPRTPEVSYFGAIPYWSKRKRFREGFSHFNGISSGKQALLWKYFEQATRGPLVPHNQTGAPDCVGQASSLACDILAACDIFMKNQRERWVAKASPEMIYAGSRVQIGQNKIKGSGSHGEWAAQWLNRYGVLHRLPYGDSQNYINLMQYNPERSNQFANIGVPKWLEPFAKEHPIATYTQVKNYREAADALYVGQPVIICSSYSFEDKRDHQGFIKPNLGWRRKKWYHAWCMVAYDDTISRPGGLLINSHGNWCTGPKRYDQPDGSHWVDAKYIDLMIGEWEDSYAFSAYLGHPQRMLRHRLY